jgi:hypothetical protein
MPPRSPQYGHRFRGKRFSFIYFARRFLCAAEILAPAPALFLLSQVWPYHPNRAVPCTSYTAWLWECAVALRISCKVVHTWTKRDDKWRSGLFRQFR